MKKIFLLILTSVYIFAMSPNIDAYTEFKYTYYYDGIRIDSHNIIKYKFNKEKNQYGSRDILLYSLKHLSKEVQNNGYDKFYLVYNNKEKKKTILIEDLLKEFNPSIQKGLVYNHQKGKSDSGMKLGSFLAFAGNIALMTAGAKAGNGIILGNGLDGVLSNKKGNLLNDVFKGSNQNELNALANNIIYDTSDLAIIAGDFTLEEEKYLYHILLDTNDINAYFKKQNPFRIKELNSTNKNYFVRGLRKE